MEFAFQFLKRMNKIFRSKGCFKRSLNFYVSFHLLQKKNWNPFGKFDDGEDKTILFCDRNFTNFLSVYPFRTTEMVNWLLLIIFFRMLIPCKRRYKKELWISNNCLLSDGFKLALLWTLSHSQIVPTVMLPAGPSYCREDERETLPRWTCLDSGCARPKLTEGLENNQKLY